MNPLPMRLMLDSHVYDRVIATPGLPELIGRLHDAGKVVILRTHIQEDEIERTPDIVKRQRLQSIAGTKIPTSGAVWDVSRWGEATYGDGAGDIKIGDVAGQSGNHVEDALIAATAALAADALVTEDKRLSNRAKAANTKIALWNFATFEAHIRSL